VSQKTIEIIGAEEHNLKNIDLVIPKGKLVVFTGISGSGKSSLAFDTIFAEGQRRYLESFSAYARQFIGDMKRPEVEKINGLSPVISIEQKTVSKNPRSTVGTITEVYDFFRLLYARAGDAYSHVSGKRMQKMLPQEIFDHIQSNFAEQKIAVLAPLVRSRKGHYRELFEYWRKKGYELMRIDGALVEISAGMKLDRYKTHNIELVVDRLTVSDKPARLDKSLQLALKLGEGTLYVLQNDKMVPYSRHFMDPENNLSYEDPQPNSFSFNSPQGYCENCEGLGETATINDEFIMPDRKLSINKGGIVPVGELRDNYTFSLLRAVAKQYDFSLAQPLEKISEENIQRLLHGTDETITVPQTRPDGKKSSYQANFKGILNIVQQSYHEATDDKMRAWAEEFMHSTVCEVCNGARLKKESLNFKLADKNIAEIANMNLGEVKKWLGEAPALLSERQKIIVTELLKEIETRVDFLIGVGLHYLTLNSPAGILSGGEAQRIRLATQIGSKLQNVLYILDEPSIGLHQRDNERLINSLKDLRDTGNSVIVVEHDKDMMLESDFLVEIGPGAGIHGGHIVAQGDLETFKTYNTTTAQYLAGKLKIETPKKRRKAGKEKIVVTGCSGNNLKDVTLEVPIGIFTCVTGVSGSGKSSLINQTLHPILHNHVNRSHYRPLPYKTAKGIEKVDKIIKIDQSPIGRTPRSNPATYVGVFTDIRSLFAGLPESKIRGYKAGRFSFNVKGGRCEGCRGGGRKVIEMNFLPNVEVLCDICQGKRYNHETLEVRFKGKSIYDVLEMTIEQACAFFEPIHFIHRKLSTLLDVGLGYLTLGQSSTTISGGEAQRVKLSTELSKRDTGNTVYILDEPTTGLHFYDIKQLLTVLQSLADKGNTVIVIEHNMDVIKVADWIIDVGPEGGNAGGEIVAQGTPEEVAKSKESHTARFLKLEL
jgi:excinuclease ABC subunit A